MRSIDFSWFFTLLGALLFTPAFPQPALSPLTLVALLPVMETVARVGKLSGAFLHGLFFGALHFGGLLYWLVPVMVRFGGFPWPLALGIHGLLVLYLGIYSALALVLGTAFGIFRRPSLKGGILWAFLWAFMEFLRGRLLTGFPWEPLGAALAPSVYLIQPASLPGGVYLLSALLAGSNYLLWMILRGYHRPRLLGSILLGLWGAILLYAWGTVPSVSSSFPRIAIVQGNIPQDVKWTPGKERWSLEKYFSLSRKALEECHPEVILWPETAVTFFFPHSPDLSARLIEGIKELGVTVLLGAPRIAQEEDRYVMKNSLLVFSPKGELKGIYDKEHLVPFGEYVPLEKYLPWLRNLAVASGRYSPGKGPGVVKAAGVKWGVLICFENVFPELARKRIKEGAELLLVITNDAWFGDSAALPQHFYQSVLRAVETRRYVIQVANTGLSGVIDPYGRILSLGPINREWVGCFGYF